MDIEKRFWRSGLVCDKNVSKRTKKLKHSLLRTDSASNRFYFEILVIEKEFWKILAYHKVTSLYCTTQNNFVHTIFSKYLTSFITVHDSRPNEAAFACLKHNASCVYTYKILFS